MLYVATAAPSYSPYASRLDMNPYYALLVGLAILPIAALAYLLAWGLIAPGLAWQNVQDRRS